MDTVCLSRVRPANDDRIQAGNAVGKLRLLSNDGSIEGEGLRSPSVRRRTLPGPISLPFVTPPTTLDLKSKEGDVAATVPKERAYRVTVKSTDGPPSPPTRVHAIATGQEVAR
jgi:hypothetical protein